MARQKEEQRINLFGKTKNQLFYWSNIFDHLSIIFPQFLTPLRFDLPRK